MKNNKGVTLVSVIVILIVIIIIASVSIVGGSGLIIESKEHVKEENLIAVKDAIRRKQTEVSMSGVLTPGGATYVGLKNPVVGRREDGKELYAGEDWYLLEENDLKELGIETDDTKYIVNYKLEAVLAVDGEYAGTLYEEIVKLSN